jgi:hypothetical protein
MTVRELSSRIEKFRAELEEHVKLWGESLDNTFPEYPIRNHERIRKQYDSLARQLGTLRPYFNRLGLPSIMGNAYGQWDAYDSADVAVRKGSSIQAVLSQLQQALGKLDSMAPDSEFPLQQEHIHVRPEPQQVTNIYNLQGANSRVNVQSRDHSVNVSTITEQQVFSQVREAVIKGVPDEGEKLAILEKLDAMEKSIRSADFLPKYQAFINAVANHMTIILPFIPALTQMLHH